MGTVSSDRMEQLDRDRVDGDAVRFLANVVGKQGEQLRTIESVVMTINSTIGAIHLAMAELQSILNTINMRVDAALMTPEQKAAQLAKARDIIEKMKNEAEGEIQMQLQRRSERGISKDGDALTPAERAAWEAGHELPES